MYKTRQSTRLRMFFTGIILFALSQARAADVPLPSEGQAEPTTPDVEAQKFSGTWKLVSLEKDGVKVDAQKISDVRLIFDAKEYTYKGQDGKRDQGTFQLDLAHSPAIVVTRQVDGVKLGKAMSRIYTWVDQDTLKFCAPGPDEMTPDGFTAPHGSGRELAVWKRTKM